MGIAFFSFSPGDGIQNAEAFLNQKKGGLYDKHNCKKTKR
jgi:hypothetical protein